LKRKNLPIRGQILSIRDHGCLVDLGFGRKGFLKFEDAEGGTYTVLDADEGIKSDADDEEKEAEEARGNTEATQSRRADSGTDDPTSLARSRAEALLNRADEGRSCSGKGAPTRGDADSDSSSGSSSSSEGGSYSSSGSSGSRGAPKSAFPSGHLAYMNQPKTEHEDDGDSLGSTDLFDEPKGPRPAKPLLAATQKAAAAREQSQSASNTDSGPAKPASAGRHLENTNQPQSVDDEGDSLPKRIRALRSRRLPVATSRT
jgi:hypothetical protein